METGMVKSVPSTTPRAPVMISLVTVDKVSCINKYQKSDDIVTHH